MRALPLFRRDLNQLDGLSRSWRCRACPFWPEVAYLAVSRFTRLIVLYHDGLQIHDATDTDTCSFDDDPGTAGPLGQPSEVAARVGQAVRVVDAEAVELAFVQEL